MDATVLHSVIVVLHKETAFPLILLLSGIGPIAESDFPYCDTCYRRIVCPSACVSSVTLVHPAKAV